MELNKTLKNLSLCINKYKYVGLIILAGIMLLLIPFGSQNNNSNTETSSVHNNVEESFENRLSNILSCVYGAGKVKVLLSQTEGEEIIYQTDDNISKNGTSESGNNKTVTVTDAQKVQTGLIKQIIPAVYKGVIVVCEGADDPSVRLNLMNAVSKLTGLGTDKISVLKMK